jgi:diguanylate cyclase (GGDEF)-like protein
MPNTSKNQGIVVLERLRQVVEDHPFQQKERQPHGKVTISLGIAEFPVDGSDVSTMILKADQALYVAKSQGRNQIQVAV